MSVLPGAVAQERPPAETQSLRLPTWAPWLTLWTLMLLVSFATRPLMPIDETRYVSVAWEMWQRGDFLVPHLNGLPYSHKPPLLFWLIHFGWMAFGVNEWWVRLIVPLATLGSLLLTGRIVTRLWPGQGRMARHSQLILSGFLGWVFYSTPLFFDMLVVLFSQVALLGLLSAVEGRRWRGFALFALGLGLALLSKGPVALLFILPPLLLVRWWHGRSLGGRFWLYALAATVFGLGIVLAWALPAASAGGKAYADAIFLHQTADRLVSAQAHPEPFWWYGMVLPLMLFPLSVWPPAWRALNKPLDRGRRLSLAAVLPALLFLSAISSKQPHYLLALLPPIAWLLTSGLGDSGTWGRLKELCWPLVGVAFLGALLSVAPWLSEWKRLPHWFNRLEPGAGLVLLSLALLGLWLHRWEGRLRLVLAAFSTAVLVAAHLGVLAIAAEDYDLEPISHHLAYAEQRGILIGHAGVYHGEYHFAGRLTRPFEVILSTQAADWLAAHPGGRLVSYFDPKAPPSLGQLEFAQPFRGKFVGVWSLVPPSGLPTP